MKEKYSTNELAQMFIDKVSELANQYAAAANFNKTLWGRITAVNAPYYTLSINGKSYPKTLALSSAGALSVGDTVICIVPNNQMPNMFILGKISK